MNGENQPSPSAAEARAALEATSQWQAQTRRAIAESTVAPRLIWWGIVWVAMFLYAQFHSGPNRLGWAFIVTGLAGAILLRFFYPTPVKRKSDWRQAAFWLAIFAYAAVLLVVVEPWSLLQNLSAPDRTMLDHKLTAYFSIVPMFAFVLFGLWIGRFLVWIGLVETALILLGYNFLPGYFYLWMAVTGGGTLTLSGIFIRKFWK